MAILRRVPRVALPARSTTVPAVLAVHLPAAAVRVVILHRHPHHAAAVHPIVVRAAVAVAHIVVAALHTAAVPIAEVHPIVVAVRAVAAPIVVAAVHVAAVAVVAEDDYFNVEC